MVGVPAFLISQAVNVGVKEDLQEGHEQIEDEPDVYHLHVRRGGEAVEDADEEGGQDEKGGQVHSNNGFEKEGFEVTRAEADYAQEDGGQVGGQDGGQDSSAKRDVDFYGLLAFAHDVVGDLHFLNEVLGQVDGTQVIQLALYHLNKLSSVSLHRHDDAASLSVKGKGRHVKSAKELSIVDSRGGERIFGSLENVGIPKVSPGAQPKAPLSADGGESLVIIQTFKFLLGVVEHHLRYPDFALVDWYERI